MEKEKIITLTEILDYSEDEEPPSGGEGKVSTFAFACIDREFLQLPTLKFPLIGSFSNYRRETLPNVCFRKNSWHNPIKGIGMSIFQCSLFWKAFSEQDRVIFPIFPVSLFNALNHFKCVVDYCLVNIFDALLCLGEKFVSLEPNYHGVINTPSNQIIRIKINYQ